MKEYIYDGLIIRYKNPTIQTYRDDYKKINSMASVMYFYYDLEIERLNEIDREGDLVLVEKELLLNTDAYDCPKVQYVPETIYSIISNPCVLELENYENNGFYRIVKYNQALIEDFVDAEYWFKIERYDYSVKQSYNEFYNYNTHYNITIGLGSKVAGYGNRKDTGTAVYLNNLTKEEILDFRAVAESFVQESIDLFNKDIVTHTSLCCHCQERINLYENAIGDNLFKCPLCTKEFKYDQEDFNG